LAKERNKKVKKQIGIISNKRGEFVENPLEKKPLILKSCPPPQHLRMELKVWVEGIQRIVCGVTEKTTCQVRNHF
jgi:hypothetical protein